MAVKKAVKVEAPKVEVPQVNPLEERVAKLEFVVKALLHSYNGQIRAAKVGADAFNPQMAEVQGL